MAKRALIVDDSKTAQVRLRKMLEKFDIEIDVTSSAEEALGYLSYRQPAVIFLDHHMEGMSGLSALKIIKSNPATALIPVVMYTSEQGDVYVGQARALGALDIISKEVIQHSSIEKVLSSLGIPAAGAKPAEAPTPRDASAMSDKQQAGLDVPVKKESALPNRASKPAGYTAAADLNKVQAQVGKLFEIHIAKVRQEIEDSTKFLMRRLSKEIQDTNSTGSKVVAGKRAEKVEDPIPTLEEQTVAPPEGRQSPTLLFPVLVFLALIFVGYQLYASQQSQKIANEQYELLVKQNDEQGTLMSQVLDQLAVKEESTAAGITDVRVMLDALGWAVNVNPLTPFGEKPLSDQRIYMLGELLALLNAANFKGTIFIDIHLGNYCVVKTPAGEWILPEPESNLEECAMLEEAAPDVTLNDQVSIGFLNYLHSTPVLTEGSIDVELSNLGYDTPKFSYPPTTSATSAGDWNRAAALNSRLSFSFTPE